MKTIEPQDLTVRSLLVEKDQQLFIGDLCVSLLHRGPEWQLDYCYGSVPTQSSAIEGSTHAQTGNHQTLSYGEVKRHHLIVGNSATALSLQLRLADRPIVSRPQEKLALAPGSRTTLYLHTTLWICFYHEEALLLELPTKKLSDIWFGPNTMEGELAYTDTTRAQCLWDKDYAEEHKAQTEISIKNKSEEKLSLEKINLPVPELKLYWADNRYQSAGISIAIDKDKNANLSIKPLDEDKKTVLLSEARKFVSRNALSRAVNLLFA